MFKRRQTTAALHELQSHRFAMSETSCSQVMSRRNSTAIELGNVVVTGPLTLARTSFLWRCRSLS